MKKTSLTIVWAIIIAIILFSCKKEIEPVKPKVEGAYWFRATSVNIDGTEQHSNAYLIKF